MERRRRQKQNSIMWSVSLSHNSLTKKTEYAAGSEAEKEWKNNEKINEILKKTTTKSMQHPGEIIVSVGVDLSAVIMTCVMRAITSFHLWRLLGDLLQIVWQRADDSFHKNSFCFFCTIHFLINIIWYTAISTIYISRIWSQYSWKIYCRLKCSGDFVQISEHEEDTSERETRITFMFWKLHCNVTGTMEFSTKMSRSASCTRFFSIV